MILAREITFQELSLLFNIIIVKTKTLQYPHESTSQEIIKKH